MEQKVEQAEAVLNDPLIDGYFKFKESGNGNFREYLESFELDKDYDAMSDKEIYKMGVKVLVLQRRKLNTRWIGSMTFLLFRRRLKTRKMREELKKQQEDRIKNVAFETNEQSVEQQKRMQETQKKNHEQFVGLTRSMVVRVIMV